MYGAHFNGSFMSESENLQDILKSDPFGELSRKDRTMLLLISIVTIAISRAGLVPTKIVGFGIEFANIDRSAILWLLAASVLYFMITFLSHALPEFTSWTARYRWYSWRMANAEEPTYEEAKDYPYSKHANEDFKQLWKRYRRAQWSFMKVTLIKIGLDLSAPIVVGLTAMILAVMATCFWC